MKTILNYIPSNLRKITTEPDFTTAKMTYKSKRKKRFSTTVLNSRPAKFKAIEGS